MPMRPSQVERVGRETWEVVGIFIKFKLRSENISTKIRSGKNYIN